MFSVINKLIARKLVSAQMDQYVKYNYMKSR